MSLNTFSFTLKPPSRTLSLETIVPHPDDASRLTSVISATFNLVSTVIGGGVLSLPFAYATTGLLLTSIYILVAAIMASFSLYILCSCSRRTGMETYGEVVRFCFGPGAELAVECILATFLLFVTTAYMILMRDINTSLMEFFFPSEEPYDGAKVLLVTLMFCFPCMLLKSLHSLRYNCYVGFASVLTLLISITFRAILTNLSNPSRLHSGNVLIITSSPYDAAFSFPLVALAFLSQFNMLSVHASLKDPTRPRVTRVINGSIATCTALFLLFGAAGYMYALGETRDNIILNFEPDDKVVLVGKIGLGVTIMAGVSMIVLPCREALMSLPRKVRKYGRRGGKGKKLRPVGEETRKEGEVAGEVKEKLLAILSEELEGVGGREGGGEGGERERWGVA
ncbi:hypothetical protein TrCOL_g5832 [Triparma columacea]|uniref:Amino acid transporter transmembrane domain-containing protein n=1 Tax=Triparma columacea TaxID=722753 RepID=A0A9W7LDI3_9STRA|nr:hypothetical protein TrCOL_g5832 [Triparma columacea]